MTCPFDGTSVGFLGLLVTRRRYPFPVTTACEAWFNSGYLPSSKRKPKSVRFPRVDVPALFIPCRNPRVVWASEEIRTHQSSFFSVTFNMSMSPHHPHQNSMPWSPPERLASDLSSLAANPPANPLMLFRGFWGLGRARAPSTEHP